jgi:HEAT repeat protein
MKRRNLIVRLLGIALAIAAIMMTGCSKESAMQRQLGSDDPVERAAAAESLGVWNNLETLEFLISALDDTIAGVRERTAEALGRLRAADTQQIAPKLINKVFTDPDDGVRSYAAIALTTHSPDDAASIVATMLQGPTGEAQLRSVEAVTQIVQNAGSNLSPDERVGLGSSLADLVRTVQELRSELPGDWRAWQHYRVGAITQDDTLDVIGDQAAIALAWLGGMEAGRGLRDALNGLLAPVVRDSLLCILALNADTIVIDRLIGGLETNITSGRRRAVDLLAGIPHRKAETALLTATHDPAADVRRAAWAGLARMYGHSLPNDDGPVPTFALHELTPDVEARAQQGINSQDVRTALPAAVLLAAHSGVDVADHLARLVSAPSTSDEWKIAVYRTLEWIELPDAQPMAMPMAIARGIRSSNEDVKAAAIRASGRWLAPDRHGEIQRSLLSESQTIQLGALVAVRHLHDTGALTGAVGPSHYAADMLSLFSADSLVRYEAARTLATLARSDRQIVGYLTLILTNDQPERRHAGVKALGLLAESLWRDGNLAAYKESLSHAIPWLAQIGREEDREWRRAHGIWALGYLPSYETDEALGLATGDPAESVRVQAAIGLSRMRGDVGLGAIRRVAESVSKLRQIEIVDAVANIGTERSRTLLERFAVTLTSAQARLRARSHYNETAPPM